MAKYLHTAAVVVVFNPPDDLAENIASYADQVQKIFIYLNSEIIPKQKLRLMDLFGNKVQFLGDGENVGIGVGLNLGCKEALGQGFQWALTMDQDSRFEHFNIDEKSIEDDVALIYPIYNLSKNVVSDHKAPWLMTSGSLVRLYTWDYLGGFREDYFIDGIDFEYCMRLMLHNHRLKKDKKWLLTHHLGESLEFKQYLFLRFRVTNHAGFRQYYVFRNYCLIAAEYFPKNKWWSLFLIRVLCIRFLKFCVFEKKQLIKIGFAWKGVVDAFKGRKGKMPDLYLENN